MAKYSNSNNGLYLNVYIEQGAQNIAANTTTVNWRATVSRPVYYHTYNLQGDSTLSLSLDGRNVHSSNPRWEVWDGEAELASGSSVINHNADGTKTFALSCTFNPNNGLHKTMTVRANISLSSIPRLSNLSIGQGVIGSNLAITINRQNNNFTHTLRYSWAGKSGTIATNVATSHSWTIPVDFANNIPNSNSGTGTLYLDTYSGDTKIGTQSKQFTASIPSGLKPSFTGITLTDTHAAAGALLSGNDFLQIISDIKVTFNGANGTYGSKITGYRAEIVGKNHIVTENGGRLGMMNFKGSASIRAYVIDSRGQRSDTKTVNINVLEYFAPSFSFSALRTREHPNVLQVIRNARIAPITQGGRQRNTMALSFKVAQLGSSNYTADNGSATGIYTTVHTLTNSAANLSGNYPANKSFHVIGKLEDKFTSVEFAFTVATESVVMSYDNYRRVGIGKVAEFGKPGSLDVLGDIYSNNKPIQQYQLTDNRGLGKLIKQDFNGMKDTGFWWIDGSSPNNPFGSSWGMLEVFRPNPNTNECIQRFTTSVGYMAVRENGFDNNWRPWRYIAQQSETTNNSDFIATSKIAKRKIELGWFINGNVTRNGNLVTISTERKITDIATISDYREVKETIPVGFRPAQEVDLVLQGLSNSTVTGTAILHLASDGKIRLTSKSPGNKYWTGTVTYITNDPYP
jgi:hypothetical protein